MGDRKPETQTWVGWAHSPNRWPFFTCLPYINTAITALVKASQLINHQPYLQWWVELCRVGITVWSPNLLYIVAKYVVVKLLSFFNFTTLLLILEQNFRVCKFLTLGKFTSKFVSCTWKFNDLLSSSRTENSYFQISEYPQIISFKLQAY